MKYIYSIIIVLVFTVVLCFESNAQQDKPSEIERRVLSIADTFSTKYQGYTVNLTFGTIGFTVREDIQYFIVALPGRDNLSTIKKLAQAANKMGSADNYYNKIMAHQLNLFLTNALIFKEDSLKSQVMGKTAINTLIQQIVISDIKHCARFTDTYIFNKLKKQHYTDDIIREMKGLLSHPSKTREEARIIIATRKPEYSILDTIGYKSNVKQYHSLLQEYEGYKSRLKEYSDKAKAANISVEEWLNVNDTTGFKERFQACLKQKSELETYTNKINNWMRNAEKSKMELSHWLDSMQASRDTLFINSYIKETVNLLPLFHAIGKNYLDELAPDIEQLINTGKLNKDEKNEAMLQLARMQYKEYEKQTVQRIESEIKQTDGSEYSALNKLFEKLVYINTQMSFYATAPLLLNKNIWGDYLNQATIGARIFIQLDIYIKNFPFDKKQLIDKVSEGGKYDIIVNEMVIDHELGEDFLKRMYEWMKSNRGNYEIVGQ